MSKTDKLWALVHGQLDQEHARQLLDEIKSDHELQREYQQVREADHILRIAMPRMELTAEELEKKVLHAWESSPESGKWGNTATARPEGGKGLSFPSNLLVFSRSPGRALQAVAALAACFLMVLGARNYFSPGLAWMPDNLQVAHFRGEGAAPPCLAQSELAALARHLKSEIGTQYEQEAQVSRSLFHKNTMWVLLTKIQELPDRLLYVQVEAYQPAANILVGKWANMYEGKDDFLEKVDVFSRQVATDLSKLPGSSNTF